MSNSIPLFGGTLPDPNKLATGQALRSDEVIYIPEMLNYSLSYARCQPVISQCWADSICQYSDATGTYTDVATWRIPRLTDSHNSLQIRIRASAGVGGSGSGNIRFTSAGSGLTTTIAVGATTFYTGVLTCAAVGATDYDDITMAFSATTGNTIIVESVTAFYSPLATATLPAQLVDGAEPFGVDTSFDPDYPLPASMGKRMIEALEALRLRPRVLFSWSGLSAAVVTFTSGQASETMGGYPHWLSSVINPGEANKDLTVWVHTRADATNTTDVNFGRWSITVPNGTGDVWRQPASNQIVTLERAIFPTENEPEFSMPQSTWKSIVLGAETSYTQFVDGPFSDAGILSVSVWGS